MILILEAIACKRMHLSICQTIPWDSELPDPDMEVAADKAGCKSGVSQVVCIFLHCIMWQGHGKDWVPYHIRVRDFFQRWPGAMKA